MAADLCDTRLVFAADREADLMPLMIRAQEPGTPADWLIRASHNRCLPDGEKPWQHATAGASIGEIAFTMASRHGVKARAVRQQLWMARVALPASQGKTVVATCLVACEAGAPAGTKPIEWRWLTNREIADVNDAIELIDWYRARWEIEMVFNILKNACRAEALQWGTI